MLRLSVTIDLFPSKTESKHTVCAVSAIVKVHEYFETSLAKFLIL